LSLGAAVRDALLGSGAPRPKTFYNEFLYPRRGPGQFYSILQDKAERAGVKFLLRAKVTGLGHDGRNIVSVEVSHGPGGKKSTLPVDHVFSSMPTTSLAAALSPPPPADVLDAASGLRFRNFISVNVIINRADLFPDQWIYVHSPEVRLSRVQNFKNWSPAMVRFADKTSLGLEYFCSEDDELWRADDAELIKLAVGELGSIGLASRREFEEGFVVRRDNAYPVYDLDYRLRLSLLREYLGRFANFQAIGRAGLFRYGNSDLALLTGIRAAENMAAGGHADLWTYDVRE
jgi:protoporphyrinogen oxidase